MIHNILRHLDRYRIVHMAHPADASCTIYCHYRPTLFGRLRGAR